MAKNSLLKIVIWVAIAAVVGVGGYSAVRAYQDYFVPAVNTPAPPSPTKSYNTAVVVPTLKPTTASVVESTCGQTGAMTILFAGSDAGSGVPLNGADSIRLMKIDFDNQRVTVITFPHDLMVSTTALNNPAMMQQTLSLAFLYASQAATGTPSEKNAAAARVMAQIILDNFAVPVDHYLTIQMDSISAMIDTLGGVELTIPESFTTERNITFPAGRQTLTGALATEYARCLVPGGEAARTVRQDNLIKALQDKLISVNILTQIPILYIQYKEAVFTDLTLEQILSFACLAEVMPKNNITFGSIDTPELVTNNIPNTDAIKAYLVQALGN